MRAHWSVISAIKEVFSFSNIFFTFQKITCRGSHGLLATKGGVYLQINLLTRHWRCGEKLIKQSILQTSCNCWYHIHCFQKIYLNKYSAKYIFKMSQQHFAKTGKYWQHWFTGGSIHQVSGRVDMRLELKHHGWKSTAPTRRIWKFYMIIKNILPITLSITPSIC